MRRMLLLTLALAIQIGVLAPLVVSRSDYAGGAAVIVPDYLRQAVEHAGPLMFLALGMLLTMMVAGTDLSLPAVAALLAALAARFPVEEFPHGAAFWYTMVPAVVLLGGALGAINGWIVGRVPMLPPVLVTIALLVVYRLGAALMAPAPADRLYTGFVPALEKVGQIGVIAGMMLVLYVATGQWLRRTPWGRRVREIERSGRFAAAEQDVAPRHRGIVTLTFVVAGVLAVVAGLVHFAGGGSLGAEAMAGLELQALAVVLLAGAGPFGGRGSVAACALAALNIAVLMEGVYTLGPVLPEGWRYGYESVEWIRYALIVLLVAVALAVHYRYGRRRRPDRPG